MVGEIVAGVQANFNSLLQFFTTLGEALLLLPTDAMAAFKLVKEAVVTLTHDMVAAFDSVIAAISERFPAVGEVLATVRDGLADFIEIIKTIRDSLLSLPGISGAVESVGRFLGVSGAEDTVNGLAAGQRQMAAADAHPLAAQSSTRIQQDNRTTANRTTHVSVGSVAVDARGGDSQEVAAGVGTALTDQLKQAVSDFDNGLVA